MAYPSPNTIRSYPGAATPTHLNTALISGYAGSQALNVTSTSGWYEVSSSGTATTNPLGTSGPFTLVVDYGSYTEEKILCSGTITVTGVPSNINVWYDGTNNGRGYDGTPINAHASGTVSNYNVFPVSTAVEQLQFNQIVATAITTSGGTISGNLTVVSGLTVSGIATFSGAMYSQSTSTFVTFDQTIMTIMGAWL